MKVVKVWKTLQVIAWVAVVLLALCACWSLTYYLDDRIFDQVGRKPDGLALQLIYSSSGFFLFGCLMLAASAVARVREKQTALFDLMNEALRRIARGDFSVTLNATTVSNNHDHPFNELVESINHMAAELGQVEQMRQEFVSNVSHEIQSPLTSINGFARALQSDELDQAERRHYLEIIENESMRLSRLSENLLKLTALESEHPPFEPKRYRLDRQLRDIVLSLEPQWTDKAIEMDVSLEEVSIVADEELMSQIWVNLLGNGIKFTPEGGTIGVCLQKRGPLTAVCISDTGIGIAPEDQARIFERFYKADKSRTRLAGGSGLGLAISKKIAEMHGGTLQVESSLGHGTRMTLCLPEAAG